MPDVSVTPQPPPGVTAPAAGLHQGLRAHLVTSEERLFNSANGEPAEAYRAAHTVEEELGAPGAIRDPQGSSEHTAGLPHALRREAEGLLEGQGKFGG